VVAERANLRETRSALEGAKAMEGTDTHALVIADADGNYYVLPRELIEVSRIDPGAKARVDEFLNAGKSSDDGTGGYSYLGAIALPDESKWTHFTPSVAWPNAPLGRQHPEHMVMLDRPVISPPGV
jgi:hypothetical protein